MPGNTASNNWLVNFANAVTTNGGLGATYTGALTSLSVTDNVAFGTTPTTVTGVVNAIAWGYNTSGSISGNLFYNLGGGSSSDNGPCIIFQNYPAAATTTAEFNVCHDFGVNNAACGGSVGYISLGGNNVIEQFNEGYNGRPKSYPNIGGTCDGDVFDVDTNSTNFVVQYNYAHEGLYAGFLIFTGNVGGVPNPGWGNVVYRYNVGENNGQCLSVLGTKLTGTNSWMYNNSCSTNLDPTELTPNVSVNGAGIWGGNIDTVIANNLFITTSANTTAVFLNFCCGVSNVKLLNNDYFSTTGSVNLWNYNGTNYTSLAAFQSATGQDSGSLNVFPQIAGTPGTGGTCWAGGTTPPAGPQPCPNGVYQLTTGSPLVCAGVNITTLAGTPPANPSVDYWGSTVPNSCGWNIGADGAHH